MTIQAKLPAQLINVAAQFASSDPAKQSINNILVRPAKDGAGIRIDSTDGMSAFRVAVSGGDWSCEKPLLLDARVFRKRISYAKAVEIDDDLARVIGGKGSALEMLQAVSWKSSSYGDYQYPNIDQIWPSQYSCDPEDFIQFSAERLANFLAEVKRHSINGSVKMLTNKPNNPLHFTSEISMGSDDIIEMEFLLMPIYSIARSRAKSDAS